MASQVSLYLHLIDYKPNVLTTAGTMDAAIVPIVNQTIDPSSTQFLPISSCSGGVEQTLNIGSQTTGAGAGKISFNPLAITKYHDATSSILFSNAASGTPFRTAELFFVNAQRLILAKHTYKLVAVKTVSWAASAGGDLMEQVTFEYGGLFISASNQSADGKITNTSQAGWNRVRNVKDVDVNSIQLWT